MARLRKKAGVTLLHAYEAEYREIKDWYRWRLDHTPAPKWGRWEPVCIGPTWKTNKDGHWLLPESTLGWDVLAWCGKWLKNPDTQEPWTFTMEQARFILHWFEINHKGKFVYTKGVFQRLKGWGKDPMATALCLNALVGPSRPALKNGIWVGEPEPNAMVEACAVSQDQTKNTMDLVPGLLTAEAKSWYGIQPNTLAVHAMGGTRKMLATTSNPKAIEGHRPSLVIRNETQNWVANNNGLEMAKVINGNISKTTKARQARILDICNAYVDGLGSHAQSMREGWESTQGANPDQEFFGLLYDSLEAPPEAPLTPEEAPDVIRAVRGDSTWLDIERIVQDIMDPTNPPSESRRKWYNQVQSEEDAWVTATEWDRCKDATLLLDQGDEIAIFFDGGKSDDATAAVACRITDGAVFTVGMWQRPPEVRARTWVAPRTKIDDTIRRWLDEYNVVALWCDPSHARDDETMELFWHGIVDGWHRDYSSQLRLWARQGRDGHSTMWDMSDPKHSKDFVEAVGRTTAEIADAQLLHDGEVRLRNHVLNCRRVPTKWGMSVAKNHREARRKIDLAVAMIGARHMRRIYMNSRRRSRRGSGQVW